MSCINQTMNNKDYEIIIVDDCSTDDTLKVAKEVFENNDFKNFTIDKLETNSGNASMPRNRAIDLAKGEYIHFVDDGDFLYPEALERMYAIGKKNNSDIIAGNYKGINRGVPEGMFRTGVDKDEAEIIEDRIMWAMSVQKMFKLEEVRSLGTKFDPTLVIGEDVQFFIELYFKHS